MSLELMQEIRDDLKELRANMIEVIKNTASLKQAQDDHKERLDKLEAKVAPLEQDISTIRKVTMFLSSSGVIAALIAAIKGHSS